MASKTFHINKAERNEQFYQSHNLRVSLFAEWAVVVLFYTAMHYVDAVLAQEVGLSPQFRQPHAHTDRNAGVAKSSTLRPVASMYMNLYHRSRDARYTQISFPNHLLGQLEAQSFEPVRCYLRAALGLS